jgi:diguanylate cyclase (GGDEF)-like protein
MRGGDEVLGVLAMYKQEADAFSSDHLRVLLAMSETIAMSIDNSMKYQAVADSANIDYLTGLPNARSLFLHLGAEIARCTREGSRFGVIVCDLNGFKAFNDKFGHLAGNKVLETFAARLRLVCREYDFISRMGGDEFVLVTPGLSPESAQETCQRVNDAAAESATGFGVIRALSASVGAAFFPDDASDGEQLLAEADRRMYSSKKLLQHTEDFSSVAGSTGVIQ